MTNDIKKAIEEEARIYANKKVSGKEDYDVTKELDPSVANYWECIYESFKDGQYNILSKWQESERWRNLEDEPPLIEEDSYYVLLKDEDEDTNNGLEAFEIENETDIFHAKRFYTHWKPIH